MDTFFRGPSYADLENTSRKTFDVKYVKTSEIYPIQQIMAGNPTMRMHQTEKRYRLPQHPYTQYHHYNQALWPVRTPIYQNILNHPVNKIKWKKELSTNKLGNMVTKSLPTLLYNELVKNRLNQAPMFYIKQQTLSEESNNFWNNMKHMEKEKQSKLFKSSPSSNLIPHLSNFYRKTLPFKPSPRIPDSYNTPAGEGFTLHIINRQRSIASNALPLI